MEARSMPGSGSRLERRGVVRFRSRRGNSAVASVLVLLALCMAGLGDATHVVIRGDTIGAIAKRYGISSRSLSEANGVKDPRRLQIGARLTIPRGLMPSGPLAVPPSAGAGTQHKVARGEHLTGIAKRYATTVKAIVDANGLKNAGLIKIGQTLTVPVPRPPSVEALLDRYSQRYGVDAALVKGLAWQESGWKQNVVSSAGAIGVMQVLPETGSFVSRQLLKEPADINDLEQNIKVGVRFLAFLISNTGGDVPRAVSGYFQGLRSVRQNGVSAKTQRYTDNVMALRKKFGGA